MEVEEEVVKSAATTSALRSKKRVCYYYDSEVGTFHYGANHPMKPFRITMCHELIVNYGLYRHMQVYRPRLASATDMSTFHTEEYLSFLRDATLDVFKSKERSIRSSQFGLSKDHLKDCPIFDGVWEFNQRSVGGSIDGALRLCHDKVDIAINWAGGFHHAAKMSASGFCYINDIVLAILEMLKYYSRVLYIDVDVHHGDGVEEAFYATHRVVTLSLHRYGPDFFPGTGHHKDVGVRSGRNTSLNVPFVSGIDDDGYFAVYQAVVDRVLERYRPEAVVIQCGADSLASDFIGEFNLTTRGHGQLVAYMKTKGLPLLVLGGGGYTVRNVARVWTYETALMCGMDIPNELPYCEHSRYYGPDFHLHVGANREMANNNSATYLHKLKQFLLQTVDNIEIAPSVAMRERVADSRQIVTVRRDELLDADMDSRVTQVEDDSTIVDPRDFYDDARDQDLGLTLGSGSHTLGTSIL